MITNEEPKGMTLEELQTTNKWIQDQQKRIANKPLGEVTKEEVERVQDIQYHYLKKVRELRGQYD